jgi:SAM-dependent methyltransferase
MSGGPYDAAFWDRRYGGADFVYGTEPNDFVRTVAPSLPPGAVLCLGEGEGRNAVHLAARGHAVTAVDQSAVALAKARRLAEARGVALATEVADLGDFAVAPGAWSAVVLVFVHLPPALRRVVHARAAAGLAPGGFVVLECYGPGQLGRGTGGPQDAALLPALADLRADFPGLEPLVARELERDVVEGAGHTGPAAVVQLVARRPG